MSTSSAEEPLDFVRKAVLKHTDFTATQGQLKEFVDDFKTLSGARAVIFNEVSQDEDFTITRAIAGLKEKWANIADILGFPVLNTSYNLDPKIKEAFKREGLVAYDSIADLSSHQIPEGVCNTLSKLFHIGRVYVLGLKAEGRLLGDLVFMMPSGKDILNRDMVELFGGHMTILLLQYRRRLSGFLDAVADRADSVPVGRSLIESFYRATEKLPDLVYQLDAEGRFVFINHAIERYGYYVEELLGRNILDIVHPDDRDKTHWNLKERRTGNRRTVDVEVRFITGTSATVFFRVTEKEPHPETVVRLYAEGVYDGTGDSGRFIGTLGICRDITVERDLEIRLNNQVEIFRIIAEHTEDGVWLEQFNPPRILYSNPAARKLVGSVQDRIDKTAGSYIDRVHHEDRPRVLEYAHSLDSRETPSEIEFRMGGLDGDIRWMLLRFFPVRYNGGITNKRVGMITDITDQKQYQQQLLSRIEKSEAYMKELNHRIKNNLAMIDSMISLEMSSLPETESSTERILSGIRGRVQSVGLVHQMLYDMSEEGMIEIDEYLRVLGERIVEGAPAVETPGIEFDLSDAYRMPAEEVIPLGMIANEFITNALKYAFPENGKGNITLGFRKEPDGRFILEVCDNGAPLSGEVEEPSSSGLGMDLVEALAGQLHGRFEIIEMPEGKCFRVTFQSEVIEPRPKGT